MAKKEQTNIDRVAILQAKYRKVFLKNKIGKEVLRDIIQMSGLMSSPQRRGNTVEDTFVKIGEANIGRNIMDLLKFKGFDGLVELEDEHGLSYDNLFGEEANDE